MSEISDRKVKILRAIIDDYLVDAHPLSSQEIRDKHLPQLSSATIRSELSTLEEMGYLLQPHTSAGRVPSPKAYKYYVDNLMDKSELTLEEVSCIKSYFDSKVVQVEDLVRRTAKVLTDLTNYTSVIVLKDIEKVRIKNVKLVDLADGTLLVIVVTDSGVIHNATVVIKEDMGDNYISVATNLVNNIFAGHTIEEIQTPDVLINGELSRFRQLVEDIVEAIKQRSQRTSVYMDGESKMISSAECRDIEQARNLMTVLSNKEEIASVVTNSDNIGISFKIDKGESGDGIEDCSIVTAKYTVNGKELGQIGVIGPTRMNYNKVTSVLEYINKTLNEGASDDK